MFYQIGHKGFEAGGWDGMNLAINKLASALARIRVNLSELQLFCSLASEVTRG